MKFTTPILELDLYKMDYVHDDQPWICSNFINSYFTKVPDKISLVFSTKKEPGSLHVKLFYNKDYGTIQWYSPEFNETVRDVYGDYHHEIHIVLNDIAEKQFYKGIDTFYVTLYEIIS